jgi:hypothetical protein
LDSAAARARGPFPIIGLNSKDPDAYRLLSYLPPPKGWKKPLPEPENGDPATADPPQQGGNHPRKAGRITSSRRRMTATRAGSVSRKNFAALCLCERFLFLSFSRDNS